MRRFTIVALLGLMLVVHLPAYSQSIWLDPSRENAITVEFLSPNLKFDDYDFPSSANFITGRFVSSRLIVVGELPIAYATGTSQSFDFTSGEIVTRSESQFAIGNPYIGLEFRNPDAPLYVEVGGRIPLMGDDKTFAQDLAGLADFDRVEAFATDIWTIDGAFNYYSVTDQNLILRLRAGASVFIPKGGGDTDSFVNYSAQIGYDGPAVYLLAGVTGRYLLTAEGGSFDDRSAHQVGASLGLNLGGLRPGVQVRLPIDETLKNSVKYVVGLNLQFALN